METSQIDFVPTAREMTAHFGRLKHAHPPEAVPPARRASLCELVACAGYLPWSQQQALEELSAAETLLILEEKLRLNGVYTQGGFAFSAETLSPVRRAGYTDSSWIKREGHEIKLLNLAGLGDGNRSREPGRMMDWLKQLVTLPAGDPARGILATTIYLLPFHPREFGSAYIPASSGVSPLLADPRLAEHLGLDAHGQVRLFLALAQLAGHPLLYDVLPQIGRFSAQVLARPGLVRWFDTPAAIRQCVTTDKRAVSAAMMGREAQQMLAGRVERIVREMLGLRPETPVTEEDVLPQRGEISQRLIEEGLWSAPGGAWCSYGPPVFDHLPGGGGAPAFRHYDRDGRDVTAMANLDCLAPYYFTFWDKREYNEEVIRWWIEHLGLLRAEYQFDGFRFDHVDHVVDGVSLDHGFPMSYRIPAEVLRRANAALRAGLPHYAAVAEYMLWDGLLAEYHRGMDFDLLWGDDIISQQQKDVARVVADNGVLAAYNSGTPAAGRLSILKTYNNQDGEFGPISQYPGQLGEAGALFKWFKLWFTPGGDAAARPVMHVDGDESFTPTGVQYAIAHEAAMPRHRDDEFTRRFEAIRRLARVLLCAGSSCQVCAAEPGGLASWMITRPGRAPLWAVAHEKAPTECEIGEGREMRFVTRRPLHDVRVPAPQGFRPALEWVLAPGALDYAEMRMMHSSDGSMHFAILQPGEFHLYGLETV